MVKGCVLIVAQKVSDVHCFMLWRDGSRQTTFILPARAGWFQCSKPAPNPTKKKKPPQPKNHPPEKKQTG